MGDQKVFELGKYYIHTAGGLLHICAIADSRMYGRTLIGEDGNGIFTAIGTGPDYFVNWREITRDEFYAECERG